MNPKESPSIPLHHYNSVRDPHDLEEGRVEGLNVYEALLRPHQQALKPKKK